MYYEFYCPVKILSGDNAIFNLPNELERLNAKKPLLLTDAGVRKSGVIDSFVKQAFQDAKKDMPVVFDDIPVESSTKAVGRALSFFEENNCDSIIAVGGGSVIDSAKALNMLLAENKNNLFEFVGVDVVKNRGKPFIAVPTTSGTGSEVTSVAVIFDEKSSSKLAFSSVYLMPDVALLDADMTLTMPKKLTASSGIDALSHAIEAYIGIQNNPISKAIAFKAVQMIWDNLLDAVKNGKDIKARLNMMNAAIMAGMAFSNSMVGMVHSLAHATGSVLHIPHGVAVSLFLSAGLRENVKSSSRDMVELLQAVPDIKEYRGDDIEKSERFLYQLEKFIENIRNISNIPSCLEDVGFKDEHIDRVVDLAIKDGSSIFSRAALDYETAGRIIKRARFRQT